MMKKIKRKSITALAMIVSALSLNTVISCAESAETPVHLTLPQTPTEVDMAVSEVKTGDEASIIFLILISAAMLISAGIMTAVIRRRNRDADR